MNLTNYDRLKIIRLAGSMTVEQLANYYTTSIDRINAVLRESDDDQNKSSITDTESHDKALSDDGGDDNGS